MTLTFYETRRVSTNTGRPVVEHRWRVTGDNGEIIVASSEGFFSSYGAERNYELVRQWFINESPEMLPAKSHANA